MNYLALHLYPECINPELHVSQNDDFPKTTIPNPEWIFYQVPWSGIPDKPFRCGVHQVRETDI